MTTPQIQIFERDGRGIPFVEEGEGPVKLVLLPGLGLGVASLGTLAHVLEEEGFHIIRVGVRRSAEAVTLHDLAQDVADVLAHVGVTSAWIGGHGFGGALARVFARDHADALEGVVLLGVTDDAALPDDVEDAVRDALSDADEDARLAAMRVFAGPSVDPAFAWSVFGHARDREGADVQRAALAATPVEDWSELAPNFAVLVIQGEDDRVTPPQNAERLQDAAAGRVSLARVPGAGYLGPLTHPGEVGFQIEDYLAWD